MCVSVSDFFVYFIVVELGFSFERGGLEVVRKKRLLQNWKIDLVRVVIFPFFLNTFSYSFHLCSFIYSVGCLRQINLFGNPSCEPTPSFSSSCIIFPYPITVPVFGTLSRRIHVAVSISDLRKYPFRGKRWITRCTS